MLLELHVRNLALIEKADVEFGEGLNILTGETGAGKSIIIGSVALALGAKAPRDCIRQGAPFAYVELIFSVDSQEKRESLKEMDVFPDENGILIVSRKIMPSRSIGRVGDETVTAARLRAITELLLDIHGQHEHQSLLYQSKHLEILDAYIRTKTQPLKEKIRTSWEQWKRAEKRLAELTMDEESRLREQDFLRFEIGEIEAAALKEGEEEELSQEYRRLSHSQKILENLSQAHRLLEESGLSQAIGCMEEACGFDESLEGLKNQLYDGESILQDADREILSCMERMDLDEERLARTEERLDLIRGLEAKYGGSVEQILKKLEEKQQRLEDLEHFDQLRMRAEKELKAAEHKLEEGCAELSQVRKTASQKLAGEIRQGLEDLNFLDVSFEMEVKRLDHFTPSGYDEAQFLISTNPGEPVKPLGQVASGGELSRIMLAIKTVLADTDEIPTLIFDEIDTGISGRTAQKVSEKLAYIAKNHQVICITHLPQIAAMADCHFLIEKTAREGRTATLIRRLTRAEEIGELARLLGGAKITDAVRRNAVEMKELADRTK
ncbi:MAG TPA: DNA repair protein RecN [Candidatus Enterocloster faecavium]|uniref:DNA repair protein RecN n=1 Tax=Candidatus Enterocloster faecavium TaxID=2838560 RepID=A0A9D2L6M3_9FIRM|nr:DNA repair protein RecN [Candidatus Enterocloster faecavium]